MNKSEMAAKLAAKCDLTQAKAAEIIACVFDTKPGTGIIAVELDAGNKVSIPGFGTFGTKYRAQRQGRNPATGATITIAGKTYPFFKAGKGLKDRVAD
jgi:nucleoid DNA-binding protein